jgi:signal transduction histidine kinase
MVAVPLTRHDGPVRAKEIVLFIVFPLACYALALYRERPASLRERIRARGWGLLLPVIGLAFAAMMTGNHVLLVAELASSCLIMLLAPRVATKLVPFGLLALAAIGINLARQSRWSGAGAVDSVAYLFMTGRTGRLIPEAVLLLATGCWLFLHVSAPGSQQARRAAARWWQTGAKGVRRGQEFLLLPVVVLAMLLLGLHNWFAVGWAPGAAITADLLAAGGAVLLILRSRVRAATVAAAGLLVLGAYGLLLAAYWPMPGAFYGFANLQTYDVSLKDCAIEGVALLAAGLWLVPGVMGEHLGTRAEVLEQRVRTLTKTRTDAVDTAAAELRRIERDLHDGAQARLVALGMSLQAAERLFPTSPDAALALVSEAKEASSRALDELRDLVRGIYPPVLADRGLADAIRSLAMDSPLHTVTDIDLPGDVEMPVGSAVYFAVAEALTNAARHASAGTVRVEVSYRDGVLKAQVTDDGAGGADPARGTGLTGIEHRLATFDGILAISSPPGGPTIVAIEVPCALSSGKTSSC